jgi:hypothetical protein
VDRVLNAVPSAHQAWTLPLQVAMDCLQLAPGVSAAFKDYLMCKVGAALEVPVDLEAPPRSKAGRR